MGFTLTTDEKGAKVFKKEHDGQNGKWYSYCVSVSSKDMSGNWVSGYLDVIFKKDVQINNKAVIKINKAFPTVNKYQEKTYIKWFILEFDVIEQGEVQQEITPDTSFMDITADMDDIPFV